MDKKPTPAKGPYMVRMIGWKDEPPWTMVKEGEQVSVLRTPDGYERNIPNGWFRRNLTNKESK